jgi:hypothetical protein
MRQQPQSSFDDATTMAAFATGAVQMAALPEAPLAPPALPPAVVELLELIQEGMVAVPEAPRALAGSFPGALPGFVVGAAMPEQGPAATPASDPGFEIMPLGERVTPLSLHDQDLFGTTDVAPPDGEAITLPALFRGFQLDLFGDDAGAALPSLEASIDPLPGPLAPPSLEPGKVTMFEGQSEIELDADLVQALLDENGRLVVEGDGDDLVILGATWTLVEGGPDGEGYVHYVDSGSGLSVGIRGAEILLV